MKAHYLQHVPFEGLGFIETWLQDHNFEISSTRLFESSDFPGVDEFDFLVIMGGPMSVNDESIHPWLIEEKAFMRTCLAANKPMLGICLGAQIIANCLDSKVYPNHLPEIGWFPVHGETSSTPNTYQFPTELTVMHWHGETFDLPDKSVLLARSEGCVNQAFQYSDNVIGLQFHLETTPDSLRALVENCRDEIVPGRFVQSESEMFDHLDQRTSEANKAMADLLGYLTQS